MARVLPLLLLFGVFFVLIALLRRFGGPPRAGGPGRSTDFSHRPRPAQAGRAAAGDDSAPLVMRRVELAGLRDAYSSAPVDPTQALHACARCQAIVHGASLQALREGNHGRCPVCGHRGFRPVRLADDR
jgi:DNA-directed RNA polymerase subunit RPC12/RpoP